MTTAAAPIRRDPLPIRLTGTRSPGWWGMVFLCATEGMLFASFLGGYFFLRGNVESFGAEGGRYVPLLRPVMLTVILISSSLAASWGEKGIKAGNVRRLEIGIWLTLALGLAFLGVQATEYAARTTSWTTSAYDSMFIIIVGFHSAHVIGGLVMLAYVEARVRLGHFDASRHDAVSNAILYWHFVDAVWITVFIALYLSPRFIR